MEWAALIRAVGALSVVLGLLWGALWAVRRFNLRLPGASGGSRERRLELVERMALDQRRSIALIRRDGEEHLVLLSPDNLLVIERGIVRRQHQRAPVAPPPVPPSSETAFASLIERPRFACAVMLKPVTAPALGEVCHE